MSPNFWGITLPVLSKNTGMGIKETFNIVRTEIRIGVLYIMGRAVSMRDPNMDLEDQDDEI